MGVLTVGLISLTFGFMVEIAKINICAKFCEQTFRERDATGGGSKFGNFH